MWTIATTLMSTNTVNNNSIGKDAKDFDGIGKGVMDLLITDLASSSKVRVVDRERVQQILDEQKLSKSGAMDAGVTSPLF